MQGFEVPIKQYTQITIFTLVEYEYNGRTGFCYGPYHISKKGLLCTSYSYSTNRPSLKTCRTTKDTKHNNLKKYIFNIRAGKILGSTVRRNYSLRPIKERVEAGDATFETMESTFVHVSLLGRTA